MIFRTILRQNSYIFSASSSSSYLLLPLPCAFLINERTRDSNLNDIYVYIYKFAIYRNGMDEEGWLEEWLDGWIDVVIQCRICFRISS